MSSNSKTKEGGETQLMNFVFFVTALCCLMVAIMKGQPQERSTSTTWTSTTTLTMMTTTAPQSQPSLFFGTATVTAQAHAVATTAISVSVRPTTKPPSTTMIAMTAGSSSRTTLIKIGNNNNNRGRQNRALDGTYDFGNEKEEQEQEQEHDKVNINNIIDLAKHNPSLPHKVSVTVVLNNPIVAGILIGMIVPMIGVAVPLGPSLLVSGFLPTAISIAIGIRRMKWLLPLSSSLLLRLRPLLAATHTTTTASILSLVRHSKGLMSKIHLQKVGKLIYSVYNYSYCWYDNKNIPSQQEQQQDQQEQYENGN